MKACTHMHTPFRVEIEMLLKGKNINGPKFNTEK